MSTTSGGPQGPPPGWYPDAHGLRWWDGVTWGPLAPVPYGGPTGPPQTEEESGRSMAVFAELWPLAAMVLSCFAFILPLVLYLVQKDQNRFARWHAGEALNAAITTTIIAIPIVVGVMFTPFIWWDPGPENTPNFPWFLFVGWGVLLLVGLAQLTAGIVGAVRASQGVWWRHPLAIPFVRAHRRIATRPLA